MKRLIALSLLAASLAVVPLGLAARESGKATTIKVSASEFKFALSKKSAPHGTVVFTVADPFEIHTVTFLSGEAPPDFIVPQGEAENGPPTLVIPANVAGPEGGPVYSGQGYFNSGILGDGQSYVLSFDTPGSYQYQCLIHDNMKGTITVTP